MSPEFAELSRVSPEFPKINQTRLVRNLEMSFSNAGSVLGELLQNARRAGATRVDIAHDPKEKILSVTDDGAGVGSMQSLLTVAESSWGPGIRDEECPYGMGFMSTLYAAKEVEVVSLGRRVVFDTADALGFLEIRVEGIEDPARPGTTVTLRGVDRLVDVGTAAKRLARGFSINVFLNGTPLDRPHAAAGPLGFMETDVGMIHAHGLRAAGKSRGAWTKDLAVYLQGLPVYLTHPYPPPDGVNVVHLDPGLFRARFPDRDRLIDEGEQMGRIRAAVSRLWLNRLRDLKETMDGAAFASSHLGAMEAFGYIALLNDVPFLPSVLLSEVGYPVIPPPYGDMDFLDPLAGPHGSGPMAVAREEVEDGRRRLFAADWIDGENAATWTLAFLAGMTHVQAERLDKGHWVHGHALALPDAGVEVTPLGEAREAAYSGTTFDRRVVFCERYRIAAGGLEAKTSEHPVHVPDGEGSGTIFVPGEGLADEDIVRQVSDFADENDVYREEREMDERGRFREFLLSEAGDAIALMASVLPGRQRMPEHRALLGRAFRVSVGTDGAVAVAEIPG